ncbi:hypothetical protein FB451DRAFT_1253438 [Mycena latifolia]|nr:hypothetical protein FB451DRAFT_1253438 [Mycena latifolia]
MSTMLDTQVDAHMADYNPIDIDMHQPAEPWFDTEAKMEDDATLENHFTDHESTLSVEVDMEDHYGENEYEMGDGEGEEIYEEMSSDLLDIEVYDASEPLEDATIPLAEYMNPSDSQPFDIDSPAAVTTKPSILPLAPTPAMSPLPPLDAELPDTLAPEPVEIVEEEPVDEESAVAEHTVDPPVELVTPLPADDENVETTQEYQSEYQNESGEVQEQVETGNTELPHPEEEVPHPEVDVPHPEEPHQSSDAAVSDSRAVEEPVVDPHEISEGVYIDPPPAVLVSFDSSDCPDVCLFNQPARSRSPSPSTEGHGQGYQVFTLLLHHRPILYYEPLASVFEALRQEEYLKRMPQFADSELILDAYDLQLVISEDNVYAREVTLHDLNVLHDGSDIAGPLRLRLKSVVPRFILRYHLLQDQVARLNLVPAGDEPEGSADSGGPQQEEERSDINQNDQEPLLENAKEEEVDENAPAVPVSGSNDGPADPPNLEAKQDQHERSEEREVAAAEPETETHAPHPESVHEEYADADEYVGGDGNADGDGDGEKLQHEGVDDVERLLELPNEEEEEEEEFVVVDTPGPGAKPIIPLTGKAIDDTGKEIEKAPGPLPLSPGHGAEPGPSNPRVQEDESATNVNIEHPTSTLADNSVDPPVHDDAVYQGESYDEEETQWEDAVDGDPDTTWEAEAEHETVSNESSVTLSSKGSKRSFEEVELEEDEEGDTSPPGSPGAKRTRVD